MRGTGRSSEPCSSAHPSRRARSPAQECWGSAAAGASFIKPDGKF